MPAGKDDIVAREQARAWIDAARGKWRLQILAKRVRIQRDGTRKEIPTRLRRFVEGLPWAFVKPALDYLLELAPYEGVVANGVDFGVPYRPTLTVWQRDAQSAATGAVRPDATYTLVQDLVEADADDVYGFATSSSCSESVETDYVWDAAEVGELPQGTQGVTYGLAAVNRKEDGTFDYQLVKRVALTQHVEETVVRDDALSRVTQELWDNVYTDGLGNYVDHTGAPIDVPAAGLYDGTSVRIEGLAENQDCTLRFQVVRESAKEAVAGMSCRDTAFEHEHGETTAGNASPPEHVDPASNGTFYKVESRLQQDGSYLTTSERTDEHEQESGKDYRRTTRALITTTTTRNTPQQAQEPSSPGERQAHEMTPGGRYNLTVVTAEPNAEPDSARCAKTVFEEVHDTVTMTDAINPDAHGAAGGGQHSEVVQDMDEYGVVKRVDRVTTEQMQESGKDYRRTTRALITTTTTRNTPQQAAEPSAPGERQAHEMTPGGRYNLTVVTAEPNAEPDSARCAKTVFEEVHDTVTMTDAINPDAHGAAGGGQHSEVVQDMDEYGVVKRVDRVTTEVPNPASVVEVERTLEGAVRRTVNRNMEDGLPTDPSGIAVGGSVRNEKNPGGSWNQTVVEALPEPVGPMADDCDQTHLVHGHVVVEGRGADKPSPSELPEPVLGHVGSQRLELTRYGSWKVTTTVRDAKPHVYEVTWTDTHRTLTRETVYFNKYVVFRNQEVVPYTTGRPVAEGFGGGFETCSPNVSINEFGLYDGTLHMRTLVDDREVGGRSSASGPAEQGDHHSNITLYLHLVVKSVEYTKKVTAHKRLLWSTRTNMLMEVARGETRPEFGLVSRLCGWYAEIYTEIHDGPWVDKNGRELGSGSGQS